MTAISPPAVSAAPAPAWSFSPRVCLVPVSLVRALRGCDADRAISGVGDPRHPQFLRWVFDVAARPGRTRELRFWKEEILAHHAAGWRPPVGSRNTPSDKSCPPSVAIARILGNRPDFRRGEIEVQWTMSRVTVLALIRAGEITEVNHRLTRASLAEFLERRLQ